MEVRSGIFYHFGEHLRYSLESDSAVSVIVTHILLLAAIKIHRKLFSYTST